MDNYHSVSSAIFARITVERQHTERARASGRQAAHDLAASARAAAKRERVRLEIARRPRGQTEVIGHREHRAAPKSYPSDAVGVEAAERAANPNYPFSPESIVHNANRAEQRAARAIRMARKRRRGW